MCLNLSREWGTISTIYRHLNEIDLPEKSTAMICWETDVDQAFSIEDWSDMLNNMHKCSCFMLIKETVVKLHTRWYLTPEYINFTLESQLLALGAVRSREAPNVTPN